MRHHSGDTDSNTHRNNIELIFCFENEGIYLLFFRVCLNREMLLHSNFEPSFLNWNWPRFKSSPVLFKLIASVPDLFHLFRIYLVRET